MSGISQIALVKVIDCDRLLKEQNGDTGQRDLYVAGCDLRYNRFSALRINNMFYLVLICHKVMFYMLQ